MIASLRGALVDKRTLRVTVDVGGVGYEVQVPLSTYERLGEIGSAVTLLIHTHVREDTLALFGFQSEGEKRLFERLITISGIGTRTALALLSGMGVEEILKAVRDREAGRLQKVPGVGRKTADRLVVELQDRVEALLRELPGRSEGVGGEVPEPLKEDVISALVNLGYRRREASAAVEEDFRGGEGPSFEALLKGALRALSRP